MVTPKAGKALKKVSAVALLGPRQIGKTTLEKLISKGRSALYLDLESPRDSARLEDPVAFLSQHSDKLVILDEIQRKPDLFMVPRFYSLLVRITVFISNIKRVKQF